MNEQSEMPIPSSPGDGTAPQGLAPLTWSWAEGLVASLLMLCNLAPIWITDRFPSQNGPWFLLPTQMFREYHNPAFNYAENFVRNWRPIPHMLHDALVGIFASQIPLFTAERIVLTLQAFLFPWCVWRFLEVMAPGRRWMVYPAFLLFLSYPFFRGYHDYTLSLSLYFLTLSYWYPRRHSLTPGAVAILMVLSLLTYFAHLVVFGLLAGTIGWFLLFESGNFIRALRTTLLITGPTWLFTIEYLLANRQATWIDRSDTLFRPFYENLRSMVVEYFYSVSPLAAGLSAAAFACAIPWTLWQRRQQSAGERPAWSTLFKLPLATLMLFFFVFYFIAPYKIIGWHKANTRLLPLIYVLLLTLLARSISRTPSRRALWFLWTPVVAGAVCSSVLMCRQVVAMHAAVDDFVSGMHLVGRNPTLLRILVDNPAFGGIRPVTRAHDYYHLELGGVNPGSLPALSTLSVMQYREYPVEKNYPKYEGEMTDAEAQAILTRYPYVLVFGQEPVLDARLEAAGFDEIHSRGLFHLFRRRDVAAE